MTQNWKSTLLLSICPDFTVIVLNEVLLGDKTIVNYLNHRAYHDKCTQASRPTNLLKCEICSITIKKKKKKPVAVSHFLIMNHHKTHILLCFESKTPKCNDETERGKHRNICKTNYRAEIKKQFYKLKLYWIFDCLFFVCFIAFCSSPFFFRSECFVQNQNFSLCRPNNNQNP